MRLGGTLAAQRCVEREALAVLPGSACEVVGDQSAAIAPYLRLCFAWEGEERLVEGA